MSRFFSLVVLAGLLLGCSPQPTIAPPPTPVTLRVQVTPAMSWLRPVMAECAGQTSNLTLTVEETMASAQSLDDADVLTRWSSSNIANGYAMKIGQDSLSVIVNGQNSTPGLDIHTIRSIYAGEQVSPPPSDIAGTGLYQPWVYLNDDDAQTIASFTFLKDISLDQAAKIAPNAQGMVEAVGQNPSAIGFVPSRWLDSQVKAIELSGVSTDELTVPVLAITRDRPEGAIRDWLLCLQDGIQ